MKALWNLFNRLHRDERGTVSLETVLIIGAIAIPALFVLWKWGWPQITKLFDKGTAALNGETDTIYNSGGSTVAP